MLSIYSPLSTVTTKAFQTILSIQKFQSIESYELRKGKYVREFNYDKRNIMNGQHKGKTLLTETSHILYPLNENFTVKKK